MDLPEFLSYKDRFSTREFVDKITKIAKRAGAKLVYVALILFYMLQSKDISLKDKALILGALGYLISPLDAIPDAIPIMGLGDDLTVLTFALKKIWDNVTDDVREKAYSKLSKWFDEDEIGEIGNIFDDTKS